MTPSEITSYLDCLVNKELCKDPDNITAGGHYFIEVIAYQNALTAINSSINKNEISRDDITRSYIEDIYEKALTEYDGELRRKS